MSSAEGEKAAAAAMPIPAFGDIGKAASDLVNKDFYHTAQATMDVKLKTPTGTAVTVKGKQGFDGVTSGSIEGKHTVKPQGAPTTSHSVSTPKKKKVEPRNQGFTQIMTGAAILANPTVVPGRIWGGCVLEPGGPQKFVLTYVDRPTGIVVNQSWSTAALLDTKIELADILAPGVKVDLQNLWNPSKAGSAAQKLNFAFKNANVHSRAFINYATANSNIDAVVDVAAGHDGFLVGGEAGYDVQKAAITKYSLALGYQAPNYGASVIGTQNLSVIAFNYYQKVNASTEVGVKAGYDVQAAKASGVELASKYKLDPLSFAKAKINDRGIAALAYSTKLNAGTTLGLGLSLDTNKLNEAGHKIGTSLTFEG